MKYIHTLIILNSNLRLIDSINHPKDLINKAIELGYCGIAITDHECLSAAMEVNQYAKKIKEKYPDFKIALGNEIYLTDNRDRGQKYYHFILIAKDEYGFKALKEMSTIAWDNIYTDRKMERVPLLKTELKQVMSKYKGHIIATTACIGGELSQLLLQLVEARKQDDKQKAKITYKKIIDFIEFCLDVFGQDFFIECAPSDFKDQIIVNQQLYKVAQVYGIDMVVGTDAHYLTAEERPMHTAYLNSKDGEREVDAFYHYAHLMDFEECERLLNLSFNDLDIVHTIMSNNNKIYDKIQEYDLARKQIIPKVTVKNYPKLSKIIDEINYPVLSQLFISDEIQERYWVNECWNELNNKQLVNPEYIKRLEIEADIIKYIGTQLEDCLFAYFNTFKHYIDLFWECGSIVGPGRGSATGFLSNFLLGITQLDPIRWGLPYWRFLNKERVELPDIDIDLAPSKRPAIFEAIRKERGRYGLVQVATFGTEGTKSAILTACFKKGTKVNTINGDKNIENIQAGDLVKTSEGYEKVIAPTIFTGTPSYCIKTKNSTVKNFYCTSDHEILAIKRTRRTEGDNVDINTFKTLFPEIKDLPSTNKFYDVRRRNCKKISPKWVPAKEIGDNYYGLTLIDNTVNNIAEIHWENNFYQRFGIGINNNIPISNDFCELVGIWLAEGSINKANNTVSFTINQKEEALTKRIIELMWKVFSLDNACITDRDSSAARTIAYSSSQLANFFLQLFDNTGIWKEKRSDNSYHYLTQWDKKLPDILRYIDPKKQLQIFKGWFLGDGYARSEDLGDRQAKGTTVSKRLADDMIFILHRNFINPSIDIEKRSLNRSDRCDCYNISLYGNYATYLYNYKYVNKDFSQILEFPIECMRSIDVPVIYNSKLYLKTKIQGTYIPEETEDIVYCLKMPHGNFSVNNTLVHNCRGYRSDEFPAGINIEDAQYMSGLIPQERGFLWDIKDVVYGNEEKKRNPVSAFIKEVNKYPGLLDIIMSINGLINKRSTHASGVILYDNDPFKTASFMKTPGGDLVTCFDLHAAENGGDTKYDFLVTEVSDKIIQCLELLEDENVIEKDSLRNLYNKYLHPEAMDTTKPEIWQHLEAGDILDVFQFNESSGLAIAKKCKPKDVYEMTAANAMMRLMSESGKESQQDRYVRIQKQGIQVFDNEMKQHHLSDKTRAALHKHCDAYFGCVPLQEQMMEILMDEDIAGFTLGRANAARKIVAKKKMDQIPDLKAEVYEHIPNKETADYIWEIAIAPSLG